MVFTGGRNSGGADRNPSSPPGPVSTGTCLILTLIVLVWNVFASTAFLLRADAPHGTETPAVDSMPVPPAVPRTAPVLPSPMPTASFTVRQRYLLGEKVDINRASPEEISLVPGISDEVAGAVVTERHRRGGFRRPEDLLHVRGIKDKKLKKILPFLAGFLNN